MADEGKILGLDWWLWIVIVAVIVVAVVAVVLALRASRRKKPVFVPQPTVRARPRTPLMPSIAQVQARCDVCRDFIDKGDWNVRCTCGTTFHVDCCKRVETCPRCGIEFEFSEGFGQQMAVTQAYGTGVPGPGHGGGQGWGQQGGQSGGGPSF